MYEGTECGGSKFVLCSIVRFVVFVIAVFVSYIKLFWRQTKNIPMQEAICELLFVSFKASPSAKTFILAKRVSDRVGGAKH